jgi:hypothetical protein
MKDTADQEVIDIGDLDVEAFNEFATEQNWSDGMPLYVPTEEKVAKFVERVRVAPPSLPMPPRQIVPTLQSLAANAVMAGCKPEYFPAVTAAMRGVPTLPTTCTARSPRRTPAPMVMISGPARLGSVSIAARTASARAGAPMPRPRARPMLLNIAGAAGRDGPFDPESAKYTFCFGENEKVPGGHITCNAASRPPTAWSR